jgi:hypothetical protein
LNREDAKVGQDGKAISGYEIKVKAFLRAPRAFAVNLFAVFEKKLTSKR